MSFKNDRTVEIKRSTLITETAEGSISRRDVLKAIWTTPVILAVSPSLDIRTGSTGDPGEGFTPGKYRQIGNENNDNKKGNDPAEDAWGYNSESDNTYEFGYTPSDDYAETFGVKTDMNLSLLEAVDLKGKSTSEQKLARAATAALLNAANPEVNYPYNEEKVIQLVQQAYTDAEGKSDKEQDKIFEALKDDFDEKNNLGTSND